MFPSKPLHLVQLGINAASVTALAKQTSPSPRRRLGIQPTAGFAPLRIPAVAPSRRGPGTPQHQQQPKPELPPAPLQDLSAHRGRTLADPRSPERLGCPGNDLQQQRPRARCQQSSFTALSYLLAK